MCWAEGTQADVTLLTYPKSFLPSYRPLYLKFNLENSLYLIINVCDVHAIKDVKFEVISQHSSQDIEGDVGPRTIKRQTFPHSTSRTSPWFCS